MTGKQLTTWLSLKDETDAVLQKEKTKAPYHMNVIDELRANENAHTRILIKLLQYKDGFSYPFIKYFINEFLSNSQVEFSDESLTDLTVEFNQEYIDGLIEPQNKEWAVIIENKIHNARDGEKQIEIYIEKVISHGIASETIIVVYLTRDGRKQVESYSLTPKTRKLLGDNFVELNYREHILPWLTDNVLPEVKIKDTLFESAIRQYIDHLQGMFKQRKEQTPILIIMKKIISKNLNLEGKSNLEIWEELSIAQQDLQSAIDAIAYMKDEAANDAIRVWDDITKQRYSDINTNNQIHGGYYQIYFDGVSRKLHFEWIPLSTASFFEISQYLMVIHDERSGVERFREFENNTQFIELATKLEFSLDFRKSTMISKYFNINTDRPFAALSKKEQTNSLNNVYNSLEPLKILVEKIIREYTETK